MKPRRWLAVPLLLIAGCSAPKTCCAPPTPPFCGREEASGGRALAARDCIWKAYQAGQEATFITLDPTEKNQPVTYEMRVLSREEVRVVRVAEERKNYPAQRQEYSCRTLQRDAQLHFVMSDCTGAGDLVIVP